MGDLIKISLKIDEDLKNKEDIKWVPSGFSKLDKVTSGWQKSDLIICFYILVWVKSPFKSLNNGYEIL